MEISATRTMRGPSVFSTSPVVFHRLSGIDDDRERLSRKAARESVLERLPGLRSHSNSCGFPEAFAHPNAQESSDASIEIPHLFEHVCIELQNLAGAELHCVRTPAPGFARATGANGAVIPHENTDICSAAVELALHLLNDAGRIASGETALASASPPQSPDSDFVARLDAFLRFAVKNMLPVQDRFLIRTARALDIPDIQIVGRIIQLGQGRHQQRLSATKTSHTNIVSNDLAANKDYARRLLDDLGLPVPRSERVYRKRDVEDAAKRVGGYPVVVKPNNGSMGGGVSVGMKNREEVLDAYDRARKIGRSVLVEEIVAGSDFRMLVINGRLCAAAERIPGRVVGDGKHTIEELVAEINRDPRRGDGPTQSWTRLELDDQADRLLAELHYDYQSIPATGEIVFLRRNANTSDGGTAVDVTDIVHPDNRVIAERAAKAIGLDIAGVDVLTPDISQSMWKNGGKICEINSRPGLRKHIWPHQGKRRDVTTPIIDMLFPPGATARIPIVAVTGSGDTRTTARMIEHILATSGRHVGLFLNRRVYVGGRVSTARKMKPAEAMRMIFLDPDVDVAVFELPPRAVVRHGLGCDAIDVTVVIDTPSKHSQPPETGAYDDAELLDAIAVMTRLTRKAVYLDAENPIADDPATLRSNGCRVRVQTIENVPSAAVKDREGLATFDAKSISLRQGTQVDVTIPLVDYGERPHDQDAEEAVARLRSSSVFASLCAFSLGIDPKNVYRNLASFSRNSKGSARNTRRNRDKNAAND